MIYRLNFYRLFVVLFLAFVSFLDTNQALAQMSEDLTTTSSVESQKVDSPTEPQSLQEAMILAEGLIEKEHYSKATEILWKHIDNMERTDILVLAKAHEKAKEPMEMIRALNLILSKNQKDAEVLTLIGKAHLLQKKSKEAREKFEAALEINKKFEPAYLGLIELYENRDKPNYYELRILFQDMIQNIGSRHQYLVKLCEINTLDGTFEAAIKDCKAAIAKKSKLPDAYVYLGLSYRATGDEQKGLNTLKKAANEFSNSELAQYTYAKILEEKKNYIEALEYFKAGTDVDEKSARSWLGLANSSFELRKYDVAIDAFRKACKFERRNAAAFRKAASTLRNQRNAEWAEKYVSASEHCTF